MNTIKLDSRYDGRAQLGETRGDRDNREADVSWEGSECL